jgi:glutamate-1-semialdehyde 2,1-aminomutase
LLRSLTSKSGALLICDEVISGFRLRFGGYSDGMGIKADLVTLGKILGGGMPVAAVAGPRGIMEALAPVGSVYQAGTLSGNPVSLSAGIATLRILQAGDVYERLEGLGARLDEVLTVMRGKVPFLNWRRVGSIVWPYLAEGEVPRAAQTIDRAAVDRFNGVHADMLDRGFYLPPSAYEVLFLSAAHTSEEIEGMASALTEALSGQPIR